MSRIKSIVGSVLVFAPICLGQDRAGVDPRVALPILKNVLGQAKVSGSLEYWGRCDFQKPYPDFPNLRSLSDYSGAPEEVLQNVFAPDPQMMVTRDPSGRIRMAEIDVPTEFLDIRIPYVSFNLEGSGAKMFAGPNIALRVVLLNPAVKAFRKDHNIGPFDDNWGWPGDAGPNKRQMSGELHDVTLRQALDYILASFPGFWIYENCMSDSGQRLVYFAFFEIPQASSPPARKEAAK
ncbi:MAG: hypothetical protein ACLQBK_03260 [Candidatus Sulfotelmatobacter sp.]